MSSKRGGHPVRPHVQQRPNSGRAPTRSAPVAKTANLAELYRYMTEDFWPFFGLVLPPDEIKYRYPDKIPSLVRRQPQRRWSRESLFYRQLMAEDGQLKIQPVEVSFLDYEGEEFTSQIYVIGPPQGLADKAKELAAIFGTTDTDAEGVPIAGEWKDCLFRLLGGPPEYYSEEQHERHARNNFWIDSRRGIGFTYSRSMAELAVKILKAVYNGLPEEDIQALAREHLGTDEDPHPLAVSA